MGISNNRFIHNCKTVYIDNLAIAGDLERAQELTAQDLYSPIMKTRLVHPDEEPDPKSFNETLAEIAVDMEVLNVELSTMGQTFLKLIETTNQRIAKIKSYLQAEKERQQDIAILSNKYSDFSKSISLSAEDFKGDYSHYEKILSAKIVNQTNIGLKILNVSGNGYEGNKYVYKNNDFVEKTLNTSNRENIVDGLKMPYYEYSRITANNTEKEIFPLVNFDSVEAKATFTIVSEDKKPFSKLIIESPQTSNLITNVEVSDDGINFKKVAIKSMEINNPDKKYEAVNYIAGSGILCFQTTIYLKVTIESQETTDDVIAMIKSEIVV